MSVLINMEMPQTCFKCKVSRIIPTSMYAFCLLNEKCYPADETPPSDCPLIPVPPHGRLIDADAAVANRNADMNWCYDLHDLPDYLSGCPTIIPANEEGE